MSYPEPSRSPAIRIGDRVIGGGQPCFIVAEIGINHNGDVELAKEMIDAAAEAGADSVKFQNYRTEDFIADSSLTYEYHSAGRRIIESQFHMFKRYELSPRALQALKEHCDQRGVIFHSTPTNEQGVRDLVALGCPVLKNGSDFLSHLPLIQAMGRTGLPTVLSTGMATLADIEEAVQAFRSTGNDQLLLLHCTSRYPTPPGEVHLRKIPSLASYFQIPVGFSDHSEGWEAAAGAVALGACWIEKHFTLDKNLPGPDHRFSADPEEFRAQVRVVRAIEHRLGSSEIGHTESEGPNRRDFRLSCVVARPIPRGKALVDGDIVFRRPGWGLPPKEAPTLLGRRAKREMQPGEVIDPRDLE
ncbi:MAG: N-acetylneuraminate synthase family protein [Desulfobacteraceae bacterium]|nr:N-acetylneuraminate synthase family protein [Desulfobacteraceae bacterium]